MPGHHRSDAPAGGRTWYEWGVPGDGEAKGERVARLVLMGLMAAGFHTSDGRVVRPLAAPPGNRTTTDETLE